MTKRGKQTEGKEPETSAEGVNDNLEPDLEAPEPDIDVANSEPEAETPQGDNQPPSYPKGLAINEYLGKAVRVTHSFATKNSAGVPVRYNAGLYPACTDKLLLGYAVSGCAFAEIVNE